MKLLQCGACFDIFPLADVVRTCQCGESSGGYYDGLYSAWVCGKDAVPLGFTNSSFQLALRERPQRGPGSVFTAFVIERDCPTLEHVEHPPQPCVDARWIRSRRTSRIDKVLHYLRKLWLRYPELRFGQLFVAAVPIHGSIPETFYLDDNKLLRKLGQALITNELPMAPAVKKRASKKRRRK